MPPDRRREMPSGSAAGAALADQPGLPSTGHGLGSVVPAELVEDVLLGGVEGDNELVGDAPLGPAGGLPTAD
jgi:hypothetical protein